jgi:hypothetical protein
MSKTITRDYHVIETPESLRDQIRTTLMLARIHRTHASEKIEKAEKLEARANNLIERLSHMEGEA